MGITMNDYREAGVHTASETQNRSQSASAGSSVRASGESPSTASTSSAPAPTPVPAPVITQALSDAGLTDNARNRQIVSSLIAQELPIDAETLKSVARALSSYPNESVESVVLLRSAGVEITPSSLEDANAFLAARDMLLDSLGDIGSYIESSGILSDADAYITPSDPTASDPLPSEGTRGGLSSVAPGQNDANVPLQGSGNATSQSTPGADRQDPTAGVTQNASAADIPISGSTQSTSAADGQASDAGDALSAQVADSQSRVSGSTQSTSAADSRFSGSAQSTSVAEALNSDVAHGTAGTTQNTSVADSQSPISGTTQNTSVAGSQSPISGTTQNTSVADSHNSSAGVTQNVAAADSQGSSSAVSLSSGFISSRSAPAQAPFVEASQTPQSSGLTSAQVPKGQAAFAAASQTDTESSSVRPLSQLSFKELVSALSEKPGLEASDISSEGIKRFIESAVTYLENAREVSHRRGDEAMAAKVDKAMNSMRTMLKLNDMYAYAEVPIKNEDEEKKTHLRFFANKKTRIRKDEGSSAVLHLNMPSLKELDIRMVLKGNSLRVDFFSSKDASKLLESESGTLSERLSAIGVDPTMDFHERVKEPTPGSSILQSKTQDPTIPAQGIRGFDTRA